MPSLSKPVLATYVEPRGRKGIDLLDLCRRLVGEYQYMDPKPARQLVSVEPNVPIDESNFLEMTDALININGMNPFWEAPPRAAFRKALEGKTFTRLILSSNLGFESQGPQITGKRFYTKGDLLKKQIERWFWTLKLRWTCSIINQAISHMIPDLKRRGYAGFILPHGKLVSFESLHFALLEVVPKDYVLFHYKCSSLGKALLGKIVGRAKAAERLFGRVTSGKFAFPSNFSNG